MKESDHQNSKLKREIKNCNTFDYSIVKNYDVIKTRYKRNKKQYLNVICAFDIETTRLIEIEQSIMYIWQVQFGEHTIIGRYWEEFNLFIDNLIQQLDEDVKIIFFVHNLSYEFSFLKGIYKFKSDEVFCTDKRKVLKCDMKGHIEFRCSYFLTNMSLEKFLKKYNVENKKTIYDYNKVRYPWTKLTDEEMEYCINDVKGLCQAIKKQMASDGDDILSLPYTATSYVRRDVKRAMKEFNYLELHGMFPDVEIYKLLRENFRGGDVVSNRFNTDVILENIKSVDIVSSYPSVMLTENFPMSKFVKEDVRAFNQIYKMKTHAMLFRIEFYDLNVKNIAEGHLYLSRDKCRYIQNGTFVNGRILCCDYLETTLNDIDYSIVCERYKWSKMKVICLYTAIYKMLPNCFRKTILNYYKVKTELKGCPEDSDDYYYYMKNKEKLNSSYGMSVEDIGKDEIKFIDGEFQLMNEPLEDLIKRKNRKAFLNYAWGCWTTSHARRKLADGINIVTKYGTEPINFIYSDTDSIKYMGAANFDEYNNKMIDIAKFEDAYAVDKWGEVHYMGVFEDEGYPRKNRFKTLGAKKYVLEDDKGKLHITIAGVNKQKGGIELGKLENFKEGFVFVESGGTESIFNDNVDMIYKVGNKKLHITDNIVIKDSTYTLGIMAEYRAILDGLVNIKYSDVDIYGLYKVKN